MRKFIVWIIGSWLLAHIVIVSFHVLYIFLYSVAIVPDLSHAEYAEYARVSAPWFSIIFGGPIFYLIGWLLQKNVSPHGRTCGIIIWSLYTITDATIVILSLGISIPSLLIGQWIISQSVKLFAILLATRKRKTPS